MATLAHHFGGHHLATQKHSKANDKNSGRSGSHNNNNSETGSNNPKNTNSQPRPLMFDSLLNDISPPTDSAPKPVYDGPPKKKWYNYLMKYMFSHIGLCVLITVYCVLGAFLFIAIEGGDDKELVEARDTRSKEIEELRKELIATLKGFTAKAKAYTFEGATDMETARRLYNATVNGLLQAYQDNVTNAYVQLGYDGTVHSDLQYKWTFPSAMLYAVTIVTSIGYGHINTKTSLGQLMVIAYALIGIPLMLMFLANIGELLADSIRFIYAKGICRPCITKRIEYQQNCGVYDTLEVYDSDSPTGDKVDPDIREDVIAELKNDPENEFNQDDVTDVNQKVPVPITMTAGIIAAYLLVGTCIFYGIESWTMTESGYFCFVTLATIGFGDYVPGWSNMESLAGKFKLALSAIYIVLGLAFLSMGFNLMVDEILDKVKSAGHKIGVVKDEDEANVEKCNLNNFVKRPVYKP